MRCHIAAPARGSWTNRASVPFITAMTAGPSKSATLSRTFASPDCATNAPGDTSRASGAGVGYYQNEAHPAIDQRSQRERVEVSSVEPHHERRCESALGGGPSLES